MNLSLYQLKKKLKLNKQAQGGLVAVVLAGLVGSILVSSATSWYLSMRNNIGNVEDKLEAQTIAQSEWERLSHMSLDELEAKRSELANKYSAGTNSQYQISVNLGQKGTFNGGTCGAIGSDGYANCFKDTTITVYRDGNRMFTTRTLPLMAETYTRKEIDDKFASLLRLEPIDEKAEIPEGKALYAYLDGQKLPVSQDGLPVGTILAYTGLLSKIPAGWHLCDGTNDTPDLTGRFLQGSISTVKEFISAGLPNITGTWAGGMDNSAYEASGAFYFGGYGIGLDCGSWAGTDNDNVTFVFNASHSNHIYGNSDSVQPPAYTVYYIMKIK